MTSGVAAALAMGLAGVSAGVAQAATPGKITVCHGPGFVLTVKFPERGLSITPPVVPDPNPGGDNGGVICTNSQVGGDRNERIDVYADGKFIGSAIYNGLRGAEVRGIAGPGFVVS